MCWEIAIPAITGILGNVIGGGGQGKPIEQQVIQSPLAGQMQSFLGGKLGQSATPMSPELMNMFKGAYQTPDMSMRAGDIMNMFYGGGGMGGGGMPGMQGMPNMAGGGMGGQMPQGQPPQGQPPQGMAFPMMMGGRQPQQLQGVRRASGQVFPPGAKYSPYGL